METDHVDLKKNTLNLWICIIWNLPSLEESALSILVRTWKPVSHHMRTLGVMDTHIRAHLQTLLCVSQRGAEGAITAWTEAVASPRAGSALDVRKPVSDTANMSEGSWCSAGS